MDEQKKEKPYPNIKDKAKYQSAQSHLWYHVNVPLIPLKIVNFCWHGAFASFIPFLTVYMRHLGLTVRETGILFTILPIAEVIAPVVGGAIADKTGRYKAVYMISLLMCGVFCTSFHFIPTIQCEETLVDINCESYHYVASFPKNCPTHSHNNSELLLNKCQLICPEEIYLTDYCTNRTCISNFTNYEGNTFNLKGKYGDETRCAFNITTVNPKNGTDENLVCDSDRIDVYSSCIIKCSTTNLNNSNITIPCESTTKMRYLTIMLCFALNIGLSFFSSICFTMLDATIFVLVTKHKSYFGRQRIWASAGQAVFSPLTGYLIDVFSRKWGYTDYSIALHIFNILLVAEAVAIYSLDITAPVLPKHFLKNLIKLLSSFKISSFFVAVLFLGISWGFIESFLFWFLLDLNSPKYLLGLTLTVSAVVSSPFLYKSEWFIKKLGHVNLIIAAFAFYVIRYFGYSSVYNPWWIILFESMEVCTYHLMWVTVATYSGILAPGGLLATVEGCVGGLHYGVGRGVGSLIGGLMIDVVGIRTSFRIMGGLSALAGILYAILHCYLTQKEQRKIKEMKQLEQCPLEILTRVDSSKERRHSDR